MRYYYTDSGVYVYIVAEKHWMLFATLSDAYDYLES